MEKYLSDFHRLVVIVIETTYKKLKPKIIAYRNYKTFSNDSFREELEQIVSNEDNCYAKFGNFISKCNRIFNQHGP